MKKQKNIRLVAALFACTATLPFAAGCGGGGGKTSPVVTSPSNVTGGRATITLKWPALAPDTTRLIPVTANSVRVSFLNGGTTAQSLLLTRPAPDAVSPTTTANFQDLPPGDLTVQATAYPNADGTGTPVASATVPVTIVFNTATPVALTMGSTIVSVGILPLNLVVNGSTVSVNAVAYDKDANIVLTNQWRWDNSNIKVVTVVPNGADATIYSIGSGTAIVTATETDTNLAATKTLNVR